MKPAIVMAGDIPPTKLSAPERMKVRSGEALSPLCPDRALSFASCRRCLAYRASEECQAEVKAAWGEAVYSLARRSQHVMRLLRGYVTATHSYALITVTSVVFPKTWLSPKSSPRLDYRGGTFRLTVSLASCSTFT